MTILGIILKIILLMVIVIGSVSVLIIIIVFGIIIHVGFRKLKK